MKKSNSIALAISIVAASVSLAALIVSVIALVRSFGRNKITDGEYDFYDDYAKRKDYEDISDDDGIGSDTLAF